MVGSSYYIAFGLGIVFMTIPDKYGRKTTLIVTLFFNQIGYALALFYPDIYVKIVGLSIMGFMHIKSSLSVCQLFENIEPRKKTIAITIVNGFDIGTMGISCLYYYFISNDYYPL